MDTRTGLNGTIALLRFAERPAERSRTAVLWMATPLGVSRTWDLELWTCERRGGGATDYKQRTDGKEPGAFIIKRVIFCGAIDPTTSCPASSHRHALIYPQHAMRNCASPASCPKQRPFIASWSSHARYLSTSLAEQKEAENIRVCKAGSTCKRSPSMPVCTKVLRFQIKRG